MSFRQVGKTKFKLCIIVTYMKTVQSSMQMLFCCCFVVVVVVVCLFFLIFVVSLFVCCCCCCFFVGLLLLFLLLWSVFKGYSSRLSELWQKPLCWRYSPLPPSPSTAQYCLNEIFEIHGITLHAFNNFRRSYLFC